MCFCGLCVAGVRHSHLHQASMQVRLSVCMCVENCCASLFAYDSTVALVYSEKQLFSLASLVPGNLLAQIKTNAPTSCQHNHPGGNLTSLIFTKAQSSLSAVEYLMTNMSG